ncbi:cytidine/deoxycytidylate deaminase family protein [Patescibacteria group bacterium]|nr:cytidine/deoxycytidylate deaminase family protein [Patescibacteria group bacterium]MBU1921900.1 cytidine/deoxycytidylate deaminase family protein [Patescibacteria group bacterium]
MEEEKYFRPNWDDYFMALARIVATRGTCDRLRAGAILVKDKRIISTGYNGSPPGLPHCDGKEGHLMEEGHCIRTIHGEHNTILQAAKIPGASTDGGTLYCTYGPCMHCCKYVVAAGIKRIVFGKVYRAEQAIKYLRNAGLQVDIYEEKKDINDFFSNLFQRQIEVMKPKEGDVKLRNE